MPPIDHSAIRAIIKGFTCGYCDAQSGYDITYADYNIVQGAWGDLVAGQAFAILTCRNCQMPNLIIFDVAECDMPIDEDEIGPFLIEHPEIVRHSYDETDGTMWQVFLKNPGQYPYGHKFSKSVPWSIQNDLYEAGNCLAVRASNAAAAMCRRVVERLADHLGAPRRRTLKQTLDELENHGADQVIISALRSVKDWGNVGAHSGKDGDVDLPQARELFSLVVTLVEYVFSHDLIKNMTDKLAEEHKRRKTGGITAS